MKNLFLLKTRKIRHLMVSCVAPSVFDKYTRSIKTRSMIAFLRKRNQKNLIGVEIGVLAGDHAKNMLTNLDIKTLFLIDPYESFQFVDGSINCPNKFESMAKLNLREFSDKIVFVKKKSEDAYREIPNELDFVYVDGNHRYEFVQKDIAYYYPKVKVDGVFGGHDFCSPFFGLCRAVFEFVDKEKLSLLGSFDSSDWFLVKK